MCGIFGYVGRRNAVKMALDGLKRLEYRGYDSAGIAGISKGNIVFCKQVGKVEVLEKEVLAMHLELELSIAQTRWATHGAPSQKNAHPHFDGNKTLAVVHNGIIENYESIKTMLMSEGVVFVSETDTEVIGHLIAKNYQGDFLAAVMHTVPMLKGAFAFTVIHKDYPDRIIAVGNEAPLVVGIGKNESFVSSDPNAFAEFTQEVVFLSNAEVAVVFADKLEVYSSTKQAIDKPVENLEGVTCCASKGTFEHYTLKEIFEQPQTIRSALLSRANQEFGTAYFPEIHEQLSTLIDAERILVLGCGTSWHAGYMASYLFEDIARIPVQVEISSEYRYKNPVVPHGTLVIAISQSGETADTIAAVRELQAKGSKVLSLCNVHSSTLARISDGVIYLRAGPEIAVCSTKAFTSQLVVLSLLCLAMARMRNMSKQDGQRFVEALEMLPAKVQQILETAPHIKGLADKYAFNENFFFVGRRYMYPASLEGALKLKEISYINANGYPAGELKHGSLSLIHEGCPTVALCANKMTYDKILSNLMEIKARSGPIIAIAEAGQEGVQKITQDIIWIPQTIDELAGITSVVAAQLFAYYVALARGTDIDKPRNLAKSVTVE